jgi:Tol biopolymer transport system component
MNADGSGQTQLTDASADDSNPDWSPDGRKIAFDRNGDVYVMNANGSAQTNLTPGDFGGSSPAWSPDGSLIAFSTWNGALFVMRPNGAAKTNITPDEPSRYFSPAWSPDGSRIAFTGYQPQSQQAGVWVMHADGSNQTQLADHAWGPDWSPDGTRIAFNYAVYDYIHAIDADGGNRRDLSNYRFAKDAQPDWSPDGTSIAFDTYRASERSLPAPPLPRPPPPPIPHCLVPRVIGLRLASARTKIRRRGCRVGRVRRGRSRRVGRVIAQSPRRGTVRAHGARVNLVIGRRRRS